jgi:hypothetical protein
MTDRRCGTCKWLRVTPDKAGRRVVRKENSYLCLFEVKWPALPDSITRSYSFRLPTGWYMCGDQGTECPTWEEFKR